MKVLVIGAGGIIGQHLMISVPSGIDAVFTRKAEPNHLYEQLDVTDKNAGDWVNTCNPDVIVNLAGESRPDVVEQNPTQCREVNSLAVANMASWCDDYSKHLIHVSSQAVLDPVNEYGKQKLEVDKMLESMAQNWSIIRPTFVLGIRPFPGIGRENPAERMLAGQEHQSVDDRYFAVAFAWDVAEIIWRLCQGPATKKVHHVGNPSRVSRYELAVLLASNRDVVPVKHDDLLGLAPRPLDTSGPYATDSFRTGTFADGLIRLRQEWDSREADDLSYRAKELAAFLRVPYPVVEAKLGQGFGTLHNAVTEDFNRTNPKSDTELTSWYRMTDSYLWELTAYHVDGGFNYQGMVGGIAKALKSYGVDRVLCLGDGVGSLTIALKEVGMCPFYHDLMDSRTAAFARSRMVMRFQDYVNASLTASFDPGGLHVTPFDAVVSLDYLEHVPNVDVWAKFIYDELKPGGFFVAQNAFNMGSGPSGAMPMHLAVNDHWEKDWDPLLISVGFVQLSPQWYQKPENS